jgi:hypothetical protein
VTDRNKFTLIPEAKELLQRQFEIDYAEAGEKASYDHVVHQGVRLESRWSVRSEYEWMKAIVDALPEVMRVRVASIWCDSNAQAAYRINVKPSRYVDRLRWAIAGAIKEATNGHNGVWFVEGKQELGELDPDWGEEDCAE